MTRRSGFTVLELMVVVALLGIIATITFPVIEGLSPEYSLRSGARLVGSQIHWAQSIAAAGGRSHHLRYDFESGRAWVIMPPAAGEDPDQALDERDAYEPIELPRGIRFEKVIRADGDHVDDDTADILFDPLGFEGSHIVYLRNREGHLLAVRFHSLLGVVDYSNEEARFAEF